MFNRMKNALYNAVGGLEALPSSRDSDSSSAGTDRVPAKFRYTRPLFLQLNSDDEIQVSADHVIRPIIVPRDITKLPWNSGYAEAINAGKSLRNEDQASMYKGTLHKTIQTYHKPSVVSVTNSTTNSSSTKPNGTTAGTSSDSTENVLIPEIPISSSSASTSTHLEDNIVKPMATDISGSADSDPSTPIIREEDASSQEASILSNTTKTVTIPPGSDKETIPKEVNKSASVAVEHPADPLLVSNASTALNTNAEGRIINMEQTLPWVYFGLFDGHAGSGAAVVAANTLYRIIEEKLTSITDFLLPYSSHPESNRQPTVATPTSGYTPPEKQISKDGLITGALESAFWEMDQQIGRDKLQYRVTGGCTAVVAVFLLGKLYIANAGDSRAIYCSGSQAIPLSNDFTPESERDRIRYLGLLKPELLGSEFTHLEYIRRPVRKDLGKKMLYRDGFMTGWSYKTIAVEDLRFPLIYGEGKRSRVLATIGVTRGFGDHDLKAQTTDVDIKPFLSPQPEIRIVDLMDTELTDSDVLVMGTDGLWDITLNETAATIVQKSLDHFPANDNQRYKYRYISAAQDLVMHSRGKLRERNWKTVDNKAATIDDISVFVVPLKPYKEEFIQWKVYLESFQSVKE